MADVRVACVIGLLVVARQSFNSRSSLVSLNKRSGDCVVAKKELFLWMKMNLVRRVALHCL